jgi:hypothetical protein
MFYFIEKFGFGNERIIIAKLLDFQGLKTILVVPSLNLKFLDSLI